MSCSPPRRRQERREASGGTRRDRSCLPARTSGATPACRPCHSGGLLGLAPNRGAARLVLGCRSPLLATRWNAAILGRLLGRGARPRSGRLLRIGDSAPERDAINRGRVVHGGCPLPHAAHCRQVARAKSYEAREARARAALARRASTAAMGTLGEPSVAARTWGPWKSEPPVATRS